MYPTTEIRWFQAGEIPPSAFGWFRNLPGAVQNQFTRIDYYLPLTFTGDLGVKIREGQLEIKILREKLGAGQLHKRVAGQLQSWQKWSLNVERASDTLGQSGHPSSNWLPVQKSRSLRHYRLNELGHVISMTSVGISPGSCGLEMTTIQAQGLFWWSLAFETHGIGKDSRSSLALIAAQLFDIGKPPSLTVADSMSYPGWMSCQVT